MPRGARSLFARRRAGRRQRLAGGAHRHRAQGGDLDLAPFVPDDPDGDLVHAPARGGGGRGGLVRGHRPDGALPPVGALDAVLSALLGEEHLAGLEVGEQRGVLVVAGQLEQAQALGEALDGSDHRQAQDGQGHQHLEQRETGRPAQSRTAFTRPVSGSTDTR